MEEGVCVNKFLRPYMSHGVFRYKILDCASIYSKNFDKLPYFPTSGVTIEQFGVFLLILCPLYASLFLFLKLYKIIIFPVGSMMEYDVD